MLNIVSNSLRSPVRRFRGCVEVYNASTLLHTFTHEDNLQEYTLERVGEDGKFFGFGVCQKVNVKLRDVNREIHLSAGNALKLGIDCDFVEETYPFTFGNYYITESHRDEATNRLSITAYDRIKNAGEHYTNEIDYPSAACYDDYISMIVSLLEIDGYIYKYDSNETNTDIFYNQGVADIEGTETIRELLDDIAEATQSIYYINHENKLVFRRISKTQINLTITKEDYISLNSGENRRLQTICHATELGDNISASTSLIGSTQYIRDNMFWVNDGNIRILVDAALALYGDLTINQFDCIWRGDYRLEIGDRIGLVNKDDSISYSYVFNDKLTYNGSFKMESKWQYKDNDNESASNPTSIGDALKKTYAKVDKANKQIEMVVSKSEEMENTLSQIQLDTEGITATVANQKIQTDKKLAEITSSVNTKMSANDVIVEIQNQIKENGSPNAITTSTGFTFNEDGLNISKSGSDLTTIITDNGMRIDRYGEAVLTANNSGVDAKNLHATTYLFIGVNSRFEDYDNNTRTGCFWIGG